MITDAGKELLCGMEKQAAFGQMLGRTLGNWGARGLSGMMRRAGIDRAARKSVMSRYDDAAARLGRNAVSAGTYLKANRYPLGLAVAGGGAAGYQLGRPAQPVYKTY